MPAPLRQALTPTQQHRGAGLPGQPGRQRHGVGRATEKRRPHPLPLWRHLVGQQRHRAAIAQRPHQLPHARQRSRRGGQPRPCACGLFHLPQPGLARGAVQHRHGLARPEALRVRVRGHLEAAQVRRQDQQAARPAQGLLDQLCAFPAHRVRHGRFGGAQPQPGQFQRHAPGFGHRAPTVLGRHACQRRVVMQAPPVGRRQQPGRPTQQRPQPVQ